LDVIISLIINNKGNKKEYSANHTKNATNDNKCSMQDHPEGSKSQRKKAREKESEED